MGASLVLHSITSSARAAGTFSQWEKDQRLNFLYFSRCGITLSTPSRRFLSSS
jgi:hypothetical protein